MKLNRKLRAMIKDEIGGGGVAGAMAATQSDMQKFMVPPQRVAWVKRELRAAGIEPQTQPGEDGFVIFTVDAKGAAIIQSVIDYQANKKAFGTHPVHKMVNNSAALAATACGGILIVWSLIAGTFVFILPTIALLAFIWGARHLLSLESWWGEAKRDVKKETKSLW